MVLHEPDDIRDQAAIHTGSGKVGQIPSERQPISSGSRLQVARRVAGLAREEAWAVNVQHDARPMGLQFPEGNIDGRPRRRGKEQRKADKSSQQPSVPGADPQVPRRAESSEVFRGDYGGWACTRPSPDRRLVPGRRRRRRHSGLYANGRARILRKSHAPLSPIDQTGDRIDHHNEQRHVAVRHRQVRHRTTRSDPLRLLPPRRQGGLRHPRALMRPLRDD